MPEWLAIPGAIVLVVVLMVVGNLLFCFQAAMAGGDHPNRWYMLFFATYEIFTPYLKRSFLARLCLLGSFVAMVLVVDRLLANAGTNVRVAYGIGMITLFSGFVVTCRPR